MTKNNVLDLRSENVQEMEGRIRVRNKNSIQL